MKNGSAKSIVSARVLCLATAFAIAPVAMAETAKPVDPKAPTTEAAPPAGAPDVAPANPAVPENPYNAISARNPFSLNPPPVAPAADAALPPPPPPPIQVKLSGLTDLLGRKMAFLVLTEQGPNKQPKSRPLAEGEKESGVEVLSIDFLTRSVKLNNNGQVTNLTFQKLESAPAAPVPGQPGPGMRGLPNFPNNPGGPPPAPGTAGSLPPPTANNVDSGNAGGSPELSFSGRSSGRGGVFTSASSQAAPSFSAGGASTFTSGSAFGAGSTAVPSRETRTGGARRVFNNPPPPPVPIPPGQGN